MNAKAEVQSSGLDTAKLVFALLLIIGGIYAFYHFAEQSQLLRVLGLLAVVGIAAFVALQTPMGRTIGAFLMESRTEVRKVVWPTRQETIQTTLMVFVMVLLMGVVLWVIDMILMWIVRAVTG